MYFDSRNTDCKQPFGAVPCGTAVRFRLYPAPDENIVGCTLLTYCEFNDSWQETELFQSELGDSATFSCVYTAPAEPELIWYHFRLRWADGGESCFGRGGMQPWDQVAAWQLTVYDASRPTPDWFGRGVTYQIFPDRFRRSRRREVAGLVGERWLHEAWDESPEYRPNARGEITCSDFFGGDLAGITQSLDELAALGVTTLYLCPIFEAASNHRYDTANYLRIDPLLGDEDDFRTLCREAKARGMRVLLDGVFNHTGSRSLYFNADGFYPTCGAAQGEASPYYRWYRFSHFPDCYDCWWGIRTLPAVEESEESYVNFIADGDDAVVRHWLRVGASGWRLDVADELPDEFIARIRRAVEEETPDGFLLGEVWEDGSNKIAYSRRRRYLLGRETHGLMNYPFRTALLDYLRGGDAASFRDAMETLRENYPAPAYYSALNFLSTHDTPRLLTVLGCGYVPETRDGRAAYRLSPAERERGVSLVRLAALVLYAFPGSPMLYYGDEVGMEGFEDPFNRGTYPWGHEDTALRDWFARLGALRNALEPLRSGSIDYPLADGALLAFCRRTDRALCLIVVNAGDTARSVSLPWPYRVAVDALTGQRFSADAGRLPLALPPRSGYLLTVEI